MHSLTPLMSCVANHTQRVQDNELVIVLEWAESGDLGACLKERAAQLHYFGVHQIWSYFHQVIKPKP